MLRIHTPIINIAPITKSDIYTGKLINNGVLAEIKAFIAQINPLKPHLVI